MTGISSKFLVSVYTQLQQVLLWAIRNSTCISQFYICISLKGIIDAFDFHGAPKKGFSRSRSFLSNKA